MKTRKKAPRRTLSCNQCDRKFGTTFACNLHMHVHQSCNSSWFPCQSCGRRFSKIVSLLKHREIHSPSVKKANVKKSHAQKRKKAVSRRIKDKNVDLCGNFITESEAIRIATEADNINVPDLADSHQDKELIVEETNIKRHLQIAADHDYGPTISFCNSARKSNDVLKSDSDLQVSIVSSTDVSPGPSKNLAAPGNASDNANNEKHQKYDICEKALSSSRRFQNQTNTDNARSSKSRYACSSCGNSYAWRTSLADHIKSDGCYSMASFDVSRVPSKSKATANIADENSRRGFASCRSGSSTERIRAPPSPADVTRYEDLNSIEEEELIPADNNSHSIMPCSQDPSNDVVGKDDCGQRGSKSRSQSCLPLSKDKDDFMYPCVDCGQPFKNEDLMWKHFETSHCVLGQSSKRPIIAVTPKPIRKSFKCHVCSKVLPSELGLQEHLSKHTGVKNFSCPSCHKQFAWRGSVRKHLRRTSCGKDGEKMVYSASTQDQAPVKCQKATSISDQKTPKHRAHNRTVSNVVKFHNSTPSNKSRISKSTQKFLSSNPKKPTQKEKLSHSPQKVEGKRYAVIVEEFIRSSIGCQEGFGVKEGMAEYTKIGDAPEVGRHICRVCGNIYKYKSSLKIHLRFHTGEIPYECRICMERFVTHRLCRKHVLKHGEESGSEELKTALKQMNKSKSVQKEGSKQTNKTADCFSASDPSGPNKTPSVVQKRRVSHGNSADKGKSQSKGELKIPTTSARFTMQKSRATFRSAKTSTATDASVVGDCDTSLTESGSTRQKRKRNVKYFDLGEYPDIDLTVKKKKRARSKVVEDSLGLDESFDEDEMYQDQFSCKRRRSTNGKTVGSDMLEVDESNSSIEENLSSSESSSSLQDARRVSLTKKKATSDDIESTSKLLFECKICNTKFSSRFVLRRHEVITGHAKASYECPYCKRIYSEGGAYSNHMFVHQRENGMNCDICGKELQSRTTFLNHVDMHRKNPFNCELCFEWFPTDKKLQEHLSIAHDSQKEFKCKYCKKTFDWQSNYTRHMNKHTNRKEFRCKICHYSFNIISNLKRHMASVHKGETELPMSTWEPVNPAQVDHVLNRQHQRRDLWQIKTEEDEEPVSTEKRRGRLKALKAKNRKKYNCETCDFLCSSRVELTNHLRFAHKQENNPETALIHFIIEDENFVCQLCGSLIYIRHSLKNHMRRVHQMEISDSDIAGVNKRKTVPLKGKEKDGTMEEKVSHSRAKNLHNKDDSLTKSSPEKSAGKFTRSRSKKPSASKNNAGSNQNNKGKQMNCSLCKDTFESTPLLIDHLHNFHKIPAGLEEALIALTRDVSGFN